LIETIEDISNNFYNSKYDAGGLRSVNIKGKTVYTTPSLYEALTIRRTDLVLKKSIAFYTFSRNAEVQQIINTLKSEKNGFIFRTDISDFFESINLMDVIEDLRREGFSNSTVLHHLLAIGKFMLKQGYHGLPRGLPISSTLSEYYLYRFDKEIPNRIPSSSYYCRYVDDIFIFYYDQSVDPQKEIQRILPKGLSLNEKKTNKRKIGDTGDVEFLGYSISLDGARTIKVAKSKVGKTKKRLILAFKSYLRDRDYRLLLERLRFLSSTTVIKKAGRVKPVLSGFRHVYALCTPDVLEAQMKELDTFKQSVIYSKRYFLGRNIRNILSQSKLETIKSISFHGGFTNNITQHLSRENISKIKAAWRYV